jgi:hypothetical protein
LYKLEKELMERLKHAETTGRTITLKIKFSDFKQITRSKTLQNYIRSFKTLHKEVTEIRKTINLEGTRIRLMGVTISNLETEDFEDRQLYLFGNKELKGKGGEEKVNRRGPQRKFISAKPSAVLSVSSAHSALKRFFKHPKI